MAMKGSSDSYRAISLAVEWNTTTSRTPAASISSSRLLKERKCRLQIGHPAKRRKMDELLGIRHSHGAAGHVDQQPRSNAIAGNELARHEISLSLMMCCHRLASST